MSRLCARGFNRATWSRLPQAREPQCPGTDSLGKEAELEGKKTRAFPMRFVDGAVFLGPLKVGQVPPQF